MLIVSGLGVSTNRVLADRVFINRMNTRNEHCTKEENENRKCFHIFLQADVALHSNFPSQLIGFCLPRITLLDFPGRNEYAAILPDLWYSSTIFFVLVFQCKQLLYRRAAAFASTHSLYVVDALENRRCSAADRPRAT